MERACLESSAAEIETTIAALSAGPKEAGLGDTSSGDSAGSSRGNGRCSGDMRSAGEATAPGVPEPTASANVSQDVDGGGGLKGAEAGAPSLYEIRPQAAEAALSACRAALHLCRGEYEELLRGTALFSPALTLVGGGGRGAAAVGGGGAGLRARVRSFVLGSSGSSGGGGSSGTSGTSDSASGDGTVDGVTASAAVWRAAEATWAGAAALSLFFQENYSGPELGCDRKDGIGAFLAERALGFGSSGDGVASAEVVTEPVAAGVGVAAAGAQDLANVALACDGELPYPKSGLAASLLTARIVLAAVAGEPEGAGVGAGAGEGGMAARGQPFWSGDSAGAVPPPPVAGNAGEGKGEGERRGGGEAGDGGRGNAGNTAASVVAAADNSSGSAEETPFRLAARSLSSAAWWSARACVTHERLLLSPSRSETLWREALGLFGRSVKSFGGGVALGEAVAEEGEREAERRALRRRMAGRVWLEWGLAQHHFQVCGCCWRGWWGWWWYFVVVLGGMWFFVFCFCWWCCRCWL